MGTPELIVILLIALIVIGPKKLPEIARAIGKGLGELRKATDGIKSSMNVNTAFNQFMDGDDERPSKSKKSNNGEHKSTPYDNASESASDDNAEENNNNSDNK